MSNQPTALPHVAQGKAFPPPLMGIPVEKAVLLGFAESAIPEPLTITPADIRVNLLDSSQVEAVQSLRQEINLDLHYRLDPDFISHEKKEMS
jgi:hypothetical protein